MGLGPLDCGGVHCVDYTLAVDIPTYGTYVKLTAFTSNGPAKGTVSPDYANSKVTVTEDGVYLIAWVVTHSFTASKTFYWVLGFDGVADTNSRVSAGSTAVVTARQHCGGFYLKSLVAGTEITLMVTGSTNGDDVGMKDGHLYAMRIG